MPTYAAYTLSTMVARLRESIFYYYIYAMKGSPRRRVFIAYSRNDLLDYKPLIQVTDIGIDVNLGDNANEISNEELFAALMHAPFLNDLFLENKNLRTFRAEYLPFRHLERVTLSFTDISSSGFEDFLYAPKLRVIEIAGCTNLQDFGMNCPPLPALRTLKAFNSSLTQRGMSSLLNQAKYLEEIEISHEDFETFDLQIWEHLINLKNIKVILKRLAPVNIPLQISLLIQFLRNKHKIERIEFYHFSSDECRMSDFAGFSSLDLPNLKYISLSMLKSIDLESLFAIIKQAPMLEKDILLNSHSRLVEQRKIDPCTNNIDIMIDGVSYALLKRYENIKVDEAIEVIKSLANSKILNLAINKLGAGIKDAVLGNSDIIEILKNRELRLINMRSKNNDKLPTELTRMLFSFTLNSNANINVEEKKQQGKILNGLLQNSNKLTC